MQFIPRAPREGINVSRRHPLREAATLIVAVSVGLVVVVAVIGWSVDLAVSLLPAGLEARIFTPIGDSLEEIPPLARDGPRREPLRRVLERLVQHWPEAPYRVRVEILPAEAPNALALPGGLILVTDGLLDELESENELAFILGHELGHFHHRHHLKILGRGFVHRLVLAAAGFGDALPDAMSLAGELTERSFDRRQETQADLFALALVQQEYGHLGASLGLFDRLADLEGPLGEVVAYFSTHPPSAERIERMRDHAIGNGWAQDGARTPWAGGGTDPSRPEAVDP